jgi:hypothetical protein
LFLGTLGIPGLDPKGLGLEDAESPDAVDGRGIFSGTAAVLEDIVASFKLRCLICPLSVNESFFWPPPLISKGPGAIVFALCKSPPLVAVLGLTGAYIGSSVVGFIPKPPYPPVSCRLFVADLVGGKGGNGLSRFDVRPSGDGGLCNGAVALRRSLPNGDRDPSLGVIGETLRDGDRLTGVSWPCGKNGRSIQMLQWDVVPKLRGTHWQQKYQL